MKRLVPCFIVICALLVSVFCVNVPIAFADTSRHIYSIDDLITAYTRQTDGTYTVRLGDVDYRYSPPPYIVARRWTNSGAWLANYIISGFLAPNEGTLQFSPDDYLTFNIYGLGSLNADENFSLLDASNLKKGLVVWDFDVALGALDYTLYHEMDFDEFGLEFSVLCYDSSFNLISTQTEEPARYFHMDLFSDEMNINIQNVDVQFTIPDNTAYVAYRVVLGGRNKLVANDYFDAQLYLGSSVRVPTVNYVPPIGTTEELLDQIVKPGEPIDPPDKPDVDDYHDYSDELLNDMRPGLLEIPDLIQNALRLYVLYLDEVLALTWLFGLLYRVPFISATIDLSLALGLITVIFGVGLSVVSKSKTDARERERSQSRNKGG